MGCKHRKQFLQNIERGREMKTAILIIILVSVLMGCAGSQSNVPVMPRYNTEAEKGCARECLEIFTQCNHGCGQMVGSINTEYQRKQCLNNCNQILGDCYSSCVQAP